MATTTQAVGRRKSAVARVTLTSGSGKILINKREIDSYFPRDTHRRLLMMPLELTGSSGQYDVTANVAGGGQTGQAGAVRLGIARALEKVNPDLREAMKKAGLMTRDSRKVERKKYGLAGARKRFQFSKR